MYIDPNSTIGGLPALEVRRLLRQLDDGEWGVQALVSVMRVSEKKSRQLLRELINLGYVQPTRIQAGERRYTRTLNGATLALASAAKPIKRKTAEMKLQQFMERVQQVNNSDSYLYRVKKVVIFGSYLRDNEYLNDIDIAVELAHKIQNSDERMAADKNHTRMAAAAGRNFPMFLDRLLWPYTEVMLFLKSRSRSISLHTTDDAILQDAETVTIFEKPQTESAERQRP